MLGMTGGKTRPVASVGATVIGLPLPFIANPGLQIERRFAPIKPNRNRRLHHVLSKVEPLTIRNISNHIYPLPLEIWGIREEPEPLWMDRAVTLSKAFMPRR